VLIFLLGIILVVCYATAISSSVGLIEDPVLNRNSAIMTIMLAVMLSLKDLLAAMESKTASVWSPHSIRCWAAKNQPPSSRKP